MGGYDKLVIATSSLHQFTLMRLHGTIGIIMLYICNSAHCNELRLIMHKSLIIMHNSVIGLMKKYQALR